MRPMIRLIPLDDPALEKLLNDPEGELRKLASNGAEVREYLEPLLRQAWEAQRRAPSRAPWLAYLAHESEGDRLVGICSFQGDPDRSGEVEISYGTVPRYEGRGFATEMARAMLAIAFAQPEVRRVLAHTLPVPNAPTRVLHRAGMKKTGDRIDPEEGRMWRWEIERGA
jgi:ribosomal-protein-alanine N-acetyltransferase